MHRKRAAGQSAALSGNQPRLPVAGAAHLIELPVILIPMLFEMQAQIQQRLPQHAGILQDQRDHQPAHTAVAVEERVDGLELQMRQRGGD